MTPEPTIPWSVTTVTTGFQGPWGALFDGSRIWITDETAGTLLKLDASGAILQTVTVGSGPRYPIFDGSNIWVPLIGNDAVAVVRASSGAVLATLTGNGLISPESAAFDGQRVLVTNYSESIVSLFKAADFSAIGSFSTGTSTNPFGAASDGVNFWIPLTGVAKLARF